MRIVRELDAGPAAGDERVAIEPLDTAAEVEAKLSRVAAPLVARSLPLLASGNLKFHAQDPSRGQLLPSVARRMTESSISSAPAHVLAARINGLHPWPSVSMDVAGTPVKLGLADALEGASQGAEGTVAGSDANGLLISAGSGVLRLRRLQRPGGRMLAAPEFLRGFPVAAGTVIPSRPMHALWSASPFRR